METIVFDEEYLRIYYSPSKNMGRAIWNGFVSGNLFQTACRACQELIEERQVINWMADNRKMKAMRTVDQEWFLQEIVPKLGTSSLRKMATLVSEDIFNQMAVDSLFIKGNEMIRFDNQYFKTEKEALAWLVKDEAIKFFGS